MSQAVSHGLAQRSQPFVEQEEREEAGDGQPLVAQDARELAPAAQAFAEGCAAGRKGQAMQKRLPTISNTSTIRPR